MWSQFSGWLRIRHIFQYLYILLLAEISQETLYVCLVDAANWVQVRGTAIVLRHVASQALGNVCGAEYEEEALLAIRPGGQLTEEVRDHHSGTGLNVLQGQILGVGAAVLHIVWFFTHCIDEHFKERIIDFINIYVVMLGADSFR